MSDNINTGSEFLQKMLDLWDNTSLKHVVQLICGVTTAVIITRVGTNLYYSVSKKRHDEEGLKDFQSAPYHWFWGTMAMVPKGKGIYKVVEWSELYGSAYISHLGPFTVNLVIMHPDYIKCIYNSSEPKDGYDFLRPWLGDGLLISRGKKWARNRRLLTPAFHFDILKPYQEVFSQSSYSLVERWKNNVAPRDCQNIFEAVSLMTLDSLMRCIFGVDSNLQVQITRNPYIDAVYTLAEIVVNRFRFAPFHSDVIFHLSCSGYAFRRALRVVHGFSKKVIQQRKEKTTKTAQESTRKYRDFIDMLLDCRDSEGQGLTDQEIQDEVDTFMFEGHDTTASGISWCLYNLARHPHYQQKCREEVCALLKDSDSVSWDDLPVMPYLTMCIKESLRMHAPVPSTGRRTTKPMVFPDGKVVPPDITVFIAINACHHNPVVWPQPEVFDPERFNEENAANRHPHAFIPFAAGPRNCIGQHFAMNEMKTCIAILLKHFQFQVDGARPPEPWAELVLRAKPPGLFLKVLPLSDVY